MADGNSFPSKLIYVLFFLRYADEPSFMKDWFSIYKFTTISKNKKSKDIMFFDFGMHFDFSFSQFLGEISM